MENLDIRNLHDNIVLSETSYLTARFLESRWATRFNEDIQSARAIIFVGYSLADIDIGKILYARSSNKKCVFITRANPGLSQRTVLQKFGQIDDRGASDAGVLLEKIMENHIMENHIPEISPVVFASFSPFQRINAANQPATIDDNFSFFLKGIVREPVLARSIINQSNDYVVLRRELAVLTDAINSGQNVTIVLSRLANGKTVLLNSLAIQLSDRFDFFFFKKRNAEY